jgi:gamma-glutamyl phosphate reductase
LCRNELTPSTCKKAYNVNEHLKQIEQAAKNNAVKIMKDARNRLKDKVATERPQDIGHSSEAAALSF